MEPTSMILNQEDLSLGELQTCFDYSIVDRAGQNRC